MTSPSTDTDGAFARRAAVLAEAAPGLLRSALCTGASYADLFYEHTALHRLTLHRQAAVHRAVLRPPVVERQVLEGGGLHAWHASAVAYEAVAGADPSALRTAAEAVAARLGAGTPCMQPAPLVAFDSPLLLPPDAPDVIMTAEKRALLEEAADAALALDDAVVGVTVAYQDHVRRILVATADGRIGTRASLLLGLRVAVTLQVEGRVVTGDAVSGGPYGFGYFFAHTPAQVAQAAIDRARLQAVAQAMPAGAMPVVVAGGWGGVWLHEAVGHLLEADALFAGTTPFAGRFGERVAPEGFTLIDDTGLAEGRGTMPFDDEGTPAGRTLLVEDGVLRGFLTDRRRAEACGLPPTGNGRRQDFRHAPLPRMSNLVMLPGTVDPDDLVADVRDGLYVQTVGRGTVYPGQNRFSFEVVGGFRIEQGRLTTPVAGVRIEGRPAAVLAGLTGIGNDLHVDPARGLCDKAGQVLPVSISTPTVLLQGLQVTG